MEERMLECANELHGVKEALAQEVDVNAALAPAGSIARQGTLIRPQVYRPAGASSELFIVYLRTLSLRNRQGKHLEY